MRPNFNDSLFSFFRTRLKSKQKESSWNTPPDSVFENAMLEVHKVNDRNNWRRMIPIVLFLGSVLVLFLATLFYQHINSLNKKVTTLEEYVTDLERNKAENSNNQLNSSTSTSVLIVEEEEDETEDNLSNASLLIENEINPNNNYSSNSIHTIKPIKEKLGQKYRLQATSLFKSPIKDDLEKKKAQNRNHDLNVHTELAKNEKSKNLSEIDKKSGIIESKLYHQVPELLLFPEQPHIASSKSKYFFSLLGESIFSSYTMNNTPEDYPELKGYDSYYSGEGIRADIGTKISENFSLVFSFAYNRMNNRSTLIDHMVYKSDNIIVDHEGNELYKTDMDIETPLGRFNTELNFRLDQLEAVDGEIMQNKTNIFQRLNVLAFSLGVKYDFIEINKFNVYAGSGLGFENILSSKNTMQTTVSMQDKNMTEFEMKKDGLDKLSHSYLSVFAGIGLRYSLNDNFGVVLDSRFRKSLSTLRQSKGYVEPKTFLQQFNLSLGFDYHF